MSFLKTLLILIVIPLLGLGVSTWSINSVNTELAKNDVKFTITELCTPEMLSQYPSLQKIYDQVQPYFWLKYGSLISGFTAIMLLLIFIFFAKIVGTNRKSISIIFPPLIFFSLLILSSLVLIQGIILTYSAYLAESLAIGRVHFILIGGIGLGALFGSLVLIRSALKLASSQIHTEIGKTISQKSTPKTYEFVRKIADVLGSTPPDNIVVGLEPTFYVTSADVEVLGENKLLSGETLFLSLPLMRILTQEEIKAVIGHELGHFRGKDTYYSRKFSPVYSGLIHAFNSMEMNEANTNSSDIAKIPALFFLGYILDVFHKNVSEINRKRELEADKSSAKVAGSEALATALLKISLYSNVWGSIQEKVIDRLKNNKSTRNMSLLFNSTLKYDVNKNILPELISDLCKETLSHPTDSHPPTGVRIQQLGINVDSIEASSLLISKQKNIDLIENTLKIEEELTLLQQQYYLALGVQASKEEHDNYGAIVLAAFGAHMVLADGKLKREEIDRAEELGTSLSENFDRFDFREYCHYPETLPAIEDLTDAITELSQEAKNAIYSYLLEIAKSDDEICHEEEKLLNKIKIALNI